MQANKKYRFLNLTEQ
jgi:hypothetical protein